MTAGRIMILNALLFVAIIGLGAYLMTQDYELPGPPPLDAIDELVEVELERSPTDESAETRVVANFGKQNIFDTIIPQPTATPAPPTPTPAPPNINDVTESWKLSGVLTSFAVFQNEKTREEWTIRLGESKEEKFRNQTIKVTLDSVNKKDWSATISIKELGIVQKRTIKMF